MQNRALRECLLLLSLLVSDATLAKSNNPIPSPSEIPTGLQPENDQLEEGITVEGVEPSTY
jgi:hypothetical protein